MRTITKSKPCQLFSSPYLPSLLFHPWYLWKKIQTLPKTFSRIYPFFGDALLWKRIIVWLNSVQKRGWMRSMYFFYSTAEYTILWRTLPSLLFLAVHLTITGSSGEKQQWLLTKVEDRARCSTCHHLKARSRDMTIKWVTSRKKCLPF